MPTIPLSALSQPDDDGKAVTPEVGDTVDLGKATVTIESIDGDNAEVALASVNGAPCGGEDEAGEDDGMESAIGSAGMDAMRSKLMAAAESEDKSAGRD